MAAVPAPHPVLSTHGLTVRFGGHVAVNGVTAEFHPGTLTAIVGPNGAGKTTYFNLISGQLAATAGTVRLFGEDVTGMGAPQRARLGIGRAFQLTQLFPNLTVMENVRLAVQSRAGMGLRMLSLWSRHGELIDKAGHYLERVALADKRDAPAAALAHGEQRKLEVAILLALEPQVLMFDEPTAGMSMDEVPVILDLIQTIKEQGDRTVLLVEHKLEVVRSLADRILVLDDGALVADGDPATVMNSEVVRQAYLGTAGDDA
jgi:branched-chain amino acid transport system ATP-binding protein